MSILIHQSSNHFNDILFDRTNWSNKHSVKRTRTSLKGWLFVMCIVINAGPEARTSFRFFSRSTVQKNNNNTDIPFGKKFWIRPLRLQWTTVKNTTVNFSLIDLAIFECVLFSATHATRIAASTTISESAFFPPLDLTANTPDGRVWFHTGQLCFPKAY